MARLIAALSGGVDSAVAAARALDAGHEVTAIHLDLSHGVFAPEAGSGAEGCGAPGDIDDAARVADQLGLPYEIWDLAAAFEREVVAGFVGEYAAGRTPNPCLRCNERIKFAALLARAVATGFDGVVTGHYAQLVRRDGGVELHRGVDPTKDQSYVLGVLTQDQLRRTYFPLGESVKTEVRREARERGLRVAAKPDSYDICFIPGGDTAGYLRERLGARPGDIRDEGGTVLGHHDGYYAYTIGQRKGLRLGRPAADGRPRYVLGLDAATNTVVVGPREHLAIRSLTGSQPRWCEETPTGEFRAAVQLRAHAAAVRAVVRVTGDVIDVGLDEPAYGIAPGQTAVIYDKTRVIGSAVIDTTGN
ncbi:MAG: tRNA 2-thiouridine(34) synthase MnmA [Propionibacteriaceae bacterium]|jgi:tRNA-specific 2-thiouridylase|nr:tRNA 2-thiouridine(34) synthase MnmA [Propionibacteriaceae bacterium]